MKYLLLTFLACIITPLVYGQSMAFDIEPWWTSSFSDVTAIRDVTGDGKNDLLFDKMGSGSASDPYLLMVYEQSESGLIPTDSFAYVEIGYARCLEVADIDGDGMNEVMLIEGLSLHVLKHNPASKRLEEIHTITRPNLNSVRVADMDQDGDQEVLIHFYDYNYTDSVGIFEPLNGWSATYHYFQYPTDRTDFRVGDFNADGFQDMALMHYVDVFTDEVLIAYQDSTGAFTEAEPFPLDIGTTGKSMDNFSVGDFNHDGHDDLAIAYGQNYPDDGVIVLYFDALTGAADQVIYGITGGSEGVFTGDVDCNGLDDIICVNAYNARLHLLMQYEDVGIDSILEFGYTNGRHLYADAIGLGDLNGDGLPEISVAGYAHTYAINKSKSVGIKVSIDSTTQQLAQWETLDTISVLDSTLVHTDSTDTMVVHTWSFTERKFVWKHEFREIQERIITEYQQCGSLVLDSLQWAYTQHDSLYLNTGQTEWMLKDSIAIQPTPELGFDVYLFPNPSLDGQINLRFPEIWLDSDVEVRNVAGQVLKIIPLRRELDLSDLSTGAYLLRLTGPAKTLWVVCL